jgi:hypothetical protein
MYISITGIKYKGFFKTLKFWIYTVPSFIAARKAEGNIFCEQKKNRRISPHLDHLEKQRKDDELYKK